MSNRTELRTRVREELDDTGGSPTWSDSLLDDLLVESGGWYSRLWPMQAEAYRDAWRQASAPSMCPRHLWCRASRVSARRGAAARSIWEPQARPV